jgi:hypothetical protein
MLKQSLYVTLSCLFFPVLNANIDIKVEKNDMREEIKAPHGVQKSPKLDALKHWDHQEILGTPQGDNFVKERSETQIDINEKQKKLSKDLFTETTDTLSNEQFKAFSDLGMDNRKKLTSLFKQHEGKLEKIIPDYFKSDESDKDHKSSMEVLPSSLDRDSSKEIEALIDA